MAAFTMCTTCQGEYDTPSDRRFHAQPNACPDCGPRLWLEDRQGADIGCEVDEDTIAAVARLIGEGHILAIKGLGGFHLACDATNERAVAELRRRKHRYGKPFALMARDAGMVAEYAVLGVQERAALEALEAPIVILERRDTRRTIASKVSPGQNTLGFMLPYTPLHHILMHDLGKPIVLTSGNCSNEPQVIDNDIARERLAGLADYWVMHDRDIANRLDDSVVRVVADKPRLIRRARGYAPAPPCSTARI